MISGDEICCEVPDLLPVVSVHALTKRENISALVTLLLDGDRLTCGHLLIQPLPVIYKSLTQLINRHAVLIKVTGAVFSSLVHKKFMYYKFSSDDLSHTLRLLIDPFKKTF